MTLRRPPHMRQPGIAEAPPNMARSFRMWPFSIFPHGEAGSRCDRVCPLTSHPPGIVSQRCFAKGGGWPSAQRFYEIERSCCGAPQHGATAHLMDAAPSATLTERASLRTRGLHPHARSDGGRRRFLPRLWGAPRVDTRIANQGHTGRITFPGAPDSYQTHTHTHTPELHAYAK